MRIIQTGFYFPELKCVPRAAFFFFFLFLHFILSPKRKNATETQHTDIIIHIYNNERYVQSNVYGFIFKCIVPFSARRLYSARRIPYLEKQLVREVLSISVSVLKKKENNNMYIPTGRGTYVLQRSVLSRLFI